jgi:drug/metabolite transporter (DMT)-like permease
MAIPTAHLPAYGPDASLQPWIGAASAAVAAMLYALSTVLQKRQAERVEAGGLGILLALARRPAWLLAIAIQVLGLGFHSLGLTRAPVALVQPIVASGILFVVLFAFLFLGERPRLREMAGTVLLLVGMALLVHELHGSAAIQRVAGQDLALALGSCAALIVVLWSGVRVLPLGSGIAAVALSSAAGLGQGMSDSMNRLVGAWLAPDGGWVPSAPIALAALGLFVAFGLQGLATAQNALRVHRANTVVPCIVAMQLLVPIAMAQAVYGQDVAVGSSLALGIAAAATAAGLVSLCTSPRAAASFGASA